MAFSDLTERQNELLVQLMAHELRSGQANQEFRAIDFSQGWRILLSGPAGSELLSDFGETDLLALQARGYITLLRHGSGRNFTLTAKAYAQSAWVDRPALLPTHEAVRAAAASEPVVQPAGPAASPTISLQLHDDLRRSLISGNVCTFVGASLSVGAGLPDWYNLIAELSAGIGCKLAPREWATSDALIDAAQAYVNRQGLHSLISHLKDRLDATGVQPSAAHRALAKLPISLVFTANFDDLLERAFRDSGKRVEVVVRDSSIPFMRRGPDAVNIVKLYGDLDQPDTIVLARQQYDSYFLQRPQMIKLLETELARSDMLYLGWSGSDPYFKLVFGELLSHFEQMMRSGYAVMFDVTEDQRDELRRKQIRSVELPAGDRTAQLARWLERLASEAGESASPRPSAPSMRKVLGHRLLGASSSFLDRELEQGDIRRLLGDPSTRIISVIGPGGIGKTAVVVKVLNDLESGQPLSPTCSTSLCGIAYLSTRTRLGISLEQVFCECSEMLGDVKGEDLLDIWRDPCLGTEDKVARLFEMLSCGTYIILLDNIEDLMDDNHQLKDANLRSLIDAAMCTPNDVKLLITTREGLALPMDTAHCDRRVIMRAGLAPQDGAKMLCALDQDESCGLRIASEATLRRAVAKVHGIPRALEIMATIMAHDPMMSLEELIAQDRIFKHPEFVQQLIRENYGRLDDDSRRVLEALAVFGRPVPIAAVEYLLQSFDPSISVRVVLNRLIQIRAVQFDRYRKIASLHPMDRDYIYSQIHD